MSKASDDHIASALAYFLDCILSDLPEEPGLSLKPNCYCMSGAEIEGEVIETVLRYLTKRKCSDIIASAFAQVLYKELISGNLAEYELENDLDESENPLIQYEASKIARGILRIMGKIRSNWREKEPIVSQNEICYETSAHSIKNKRRTMEDKHSIISQFNSAYQLPEGSQECALFSVFDGHGGVDAACYAASQLAIHLRAAMEEEQNLKEALRRAYVLTDQSYIEKAKQERLRSGCTGVTVLLTKTQMHVGWIGDSQAVLCKGMDAYELMVPHKPDREDERKRIEALGGCVVWFGGWRVNGSLAVSRAIGDYEQKPYVSGDPDVCEYTFTGDEKFVILGCDGLFDVIKAEKAVRLTLDHILEGKSKETAAEMLVNEAKSCGSMDNITVVVVFLDDHMAQLRKSSLTTTEFETRKVIADLSEYDVLEVADADNLYINGDAACPPITNSKPTSLSDSFTELTLAESPDVKMAYSQGDNNDNQSLVAAISSSNVGSTSRVAVTVSQDG